MMEQSSEESAVAAHPHMPRCDDDSKANDQPQGRQGDSLLETSVVVGGEEEVEAGNSHKQPRRRLKGLHKKVQEQLEFYFGDANLPRDKFLKGKIAEHPEGYVSVDVIAGFNKMKELTSDREIILYAMEKSTLLELSQDQKWVRRACPLLPSSEDEVTARTVYVEGLPLQFNHDQLQRLFRRFGTIAYISLPRYKLSSAIKGFAFVEFSTPQEAQGAVEFFKAEEKSQGEGERDLATPMEDSVFIESKKRPDEDGEEIVARVKRSREEGLDGVEEKEAEQGRSAKRVKLAEPQATGTEAAAGGERSAHKVTLLLPHTAGTEAHTPNALPANRASTPEEAVVRNEKSTSTTTGLKPGPPTSAAQEEVVSSKRQREESESSLEDETEGEESALKTSRLDSTFSEASVDGEGLSKKRRRKHKKRRRVSVADQLRGLNLRVMSKTEWLEMKKLYKQLQKEQMKKLKEENRAAGAGVGGGVAEKKKFVANCLVKVSCSEDSKITKEQLKEHCSTFGVVAYVDYADGQKEGYVRFADSGCVEGLVTAGGVALIGVTFTAVAEEEERAYFLKTRSARRHKSRLNKRKSTRGQDKVITKALQRQQEQKRKATHVRFSDSDDDGES